MPEMQEFVEFYTAKGKTMKINGQPLNKGGEGILYQQFDEQGNGDVDKLAKIFLPGKGEGKEDKIKAMLSIQPPNPSSSFAWPQEILYDKDTHEFCGYVMYMKYNKEVLGNILAQDREYRKEKDWLFYLKIAKNLAQAVAGLHQIDQVHVLIGDLNDQNVLVDMETAQVILIDNDSFHIRSGNETYRCCVGKGEYIAPEIQGVNFREAPLPTFTPNTDNFSLAILIFKLLMNGLHPFTNPYKCPTNDENSIEDNICNGRSPFFLSEYKGKLIEPPYAPPIDIIPPILYKLFKLAFVDSLHAPEKRPTAQEFYDALNSISVAGNLDKCALDGTHVFPKGMLACPWCYVEDKMFHLEKKGSVSEDFTYGSYIPKYREHVTNGYTNDASTPEFTEPAYPEEPAYPPPYVDEPNYGDLPSNQRCPQPMQYVSDTAVPPQPITSGKKTLCVVGCIGLSIVTIIGCVVSYYFSLPIIAIGIAALLAILTIVYLPKLSSDKSYKSIVEFPDFITVKCKEKKAFWYVVVPKVKVYFISILALLVMISLSVATLLGFNLMILWSWGAFSLLSIFNTFYITDKRTLWTKSVLGIIMGVFCILTIILAVTLFVKLLPDLFAL